MPKSPSEQSCDHTRVRIYCWSQEMDARTTECFASEAKDVKVELEQQGYIVWHTEFV